MNVEVRLVNGEVARCATREDAGLVLDASRRFFEGNTGRKLPQRTLGALERAGMNAANSVLYRSTMRKLKKH